GGDVDLLAVLVQHLEHHLEHALAVRLQEEVSKLPVLLRHRARAPQVARGGPLHPPFEHAGDDVEGPLLALPPGKVGPFVFIHLRASPTHVRHGSVQDKPKELHPLCAGVAGDEPQGIVVLDQGKEDLEDLLLDEHGGFAGVWQQLH
ncbi:unnamed protein product, partial [Ixodes persulcatus]